MAEQAPKPGMINYVEEPETNSSAMRHGGISDAVRQALANAQIRIAEANIRAEQGNPMTTEELHAGTGVIGNVVKK